MKTGPGGDYAYATLATLAAFAVAFLAERYLSVANLALIFLTAVLAVSVRTRMAVAVYAAVLCFLGYNFFFTAPRNTFAIESADDVLTVLLFLVVALVCGRLATRLARQVDSLRAADRHMRVLLRLGQRLAVCADAASIREAAVRALAADLDMRAALLVDAGGGEWRALATAPDSFVPGVAAVAAACGALARDRAASTELVPIDGAWLLPLRAGGSCQGVALLRPFGDDTSGHRQLAAAMARDIGQALLRARLADDLEQARVQGETERLRNALLSSVSHDLRSPLASMIGAAGTLAAYEAQLPVVERRQLVEAILAEGQRLDRYIQNLLDMTRLGHGTLKLHRDWVDAAEIVLAAIVRLRRLFPDLRVDAALPADTLLLYVHPALIEQALFNILENAAHFSPPGAAVDVRAARDGDDLRIEVRDRGPGIPEDERARIFDSFYSVARGDRGNKGTGLGLSICRGMIGAHGGSVEALPAPGGGSILRVTLPLPPAPEPDPPA